MPPDSTPGRSITLNWSVVLRARRGAAPRGARRRGARHRGRDPALRQGPRLGRGGAAASAPRPHGARRSSPPSTASRSGSSASSTTLGVHARGEPLDARLAGAAAVRARSAAPGRREPAHDVERRQHADDEAVRRDHRQPVDAARGEDRGGAGERRERDRRCAPHRAATRAPGAPAGLPFRSTQPTGARRCPPRAHRAGRARTGPRRRSSRRCRGWTPSHRDAVDHRADGRPPPLRPRRVPARVAAARLTLPGQRRLAAGSALSLSARTPPREPSASAPDSGRSRA